MSNEIKNSVETYLTERKYLNLATANAEGNPLAHTVAYASEGAVVYFVTDKKTRKVANIVANPSVAFTVDEDDPSFDTMKGIQMEGRAAIVADPAEAGRIIGLLIQKFPMFKDMPPNPDMVVIKIEPSRCGFIDSSKGFGHIDTVTY